MPAPDPPDADSPDADPDVGATVAVVLVDVDEPDAPLGCAALRLLRGRTLLGRAVGVLVESAAVGRVVVAAPPGVAHAAAAALATTLDLAPASRRATGMGVDAAANTGVRVEVVPVVAGSPGRRLLVALDAAPRSPGDAGVVVVHDPLHALSPASLVHDVVGGLLRDAGAAAALPAAPVTDTLKWVDEAGVVVGTADRTAYRAVHTPQAFRRAPLAAALRAGDDDAPRAPAVEALPRLVRGRGGRLVLVPSPEHAFRVVTADDVVLAEALLRAGP